VLTLYTYFRSSAAFRVRCALNLKGLAYVPEVVWLLTDEQSSDAYRAVNPQMLVPTLVDDGHALNQSLAIIEYLDETKPGPKLLPADPLGRARVRSLSQLIACEIHPINNLRVLKYLKRTLGHDQPTVDAWYRHWVAEGLAAFERELARGGAGRYCHGDAPTMADCCLVPQVFNAKRFDCPLDAYPATMRVFDALMALPAFDAAQPSKQPDAARAAG
jgi:maleylacetoacetate isomerase